MSNDTEKMKQDIEFIKKGLFRLGRNRIAALPVHTGLALLDEMEARAASLESAIEKAGQQS